MPLFERWFPGTAVSGNVLEMNLSDKDIETIIDKPRNYSPPKYKSGFIKLPDDRIIPNLRIFTDIPNSVDNYRPGNVIHLYTIPTSQKRLISR